MNHLTGITWTLCKPMISEMSVTGWGYNSFEPGNMVYLSFVLWKYVHCCDVSPVKLDGRVHPVIKLLSRYFKKEPNLEI